MAIREYTDRISSDVEPVYLAPNGRFHRAGCRYYVIPDHESVLVEGTFTRAFLENHCRLCFPEGLDGPSPAGKIAAAPAIAAAQAIAAQVPTQAPILAPPPMPEPARAVATASAPVLVMAAPPLPTYASPLAVPAAVVPAPPVTDEDETSDEARRRRRDRRAIGGRPSNISMQQIAAVVFVILGAVTLFVLLGKQFMW